MKFKRLIALSLSAALLLLTACTPNASNPSKKDDPTYPTIVAHSPQAEPPLILEDAVSISTHIVYATCVGGPSEVNDTTCYYFKPVRALRGDLSENQVLAVHDIWYTTFREGDEQILFLKQYSSVYYDQDLYTYYGRLEPPSYDRDAYTTPPVSEEEASVIDYLAEHPTQPEANVDDFIRSDKLEDIVEGSPLIVRVRANNFAVGDATDLSALYAFELLETLKGTYDPNAHRVYDPYGDRIFNGIEIYCNTDDITMGAEYIVMIGRERDSERLRISSRNSVYAVEDTQTVEEIRQLLTPSPRE